MLSYRVERAVVLLAAVLLLVACAREPSEYRLLCDKYCPQVDALLDEKCGATDSWELCKPWIEKVGMLVDEINAELPDKKDDGDQQYVHSARTDIKDVREGIKDYAESRCAEKLDVDNNSRFFDCQRAWREITANFTSLSADLNGAASSTPFALDAEESDLPEPLVTMPLHQPL